MNDNFSQKVKDVIAYSKEEALRLGHDQIGTEHLLLGILRDGDSKALSILEDLNVDLKEVREKLSYWLHQRRIFQCSTKYTIDQASRKGVKQPF